MAKIITIIISDDIEENKEKQKKEHWKALLLEELQSKGFKYLATDSTGDEFAYKSMPEKVTKCGEHNWCTDDDCISIADYVASTDVFDNKPVDISKCIEKLSMKNKGGNN